MPRRPSVLVVLAVLAALAAACAPERPRFHVSARLLEHVRGAVHLASGDCAIGDQHRPSLGCTAWRGRKFATTASGGVPPRLNFTLDPGERGRRVFVKLYARGPAKSTEPPRRVPKPQLARVTGTQAAVVLSPAPEIPPGGELLLFSRLGPPNHYETGPVAVPHGSVLSVGIGFDPESIPEHVASVEFVVRADAGAGMRDVLHATLRPPAGTAAWEERRVPLDAVEGAATRFVFDTKLTLEPGAQPQQVVVVPLWGAPEILTPALDDEHPNVILVSLDTLRRDFVGTLGGPMALTPHLDALARDGVVFDNATTTFPSTTGAHLSMLTGLYPVRLGVDDPSRRIQTSARLLAEAMAADGWRTAAVTEDVMLAIPVGFSRGFSHYRENLEVEPAAPPSYKVDHTIDAALAWLDANRDERFFLFVHTYAVHFPYAAPEEYQLKRWKDGEGDRPFEDLPPKLRLRARYAADVRQADAQVGRLVEAIRRLGLERRTILVVTSDHGEAFYEHFNKWGHGMMIYDEIMRVPVIMWAPGRLPAGRRIRTPVSLIDLPPTILELAGAPPIPGLDGASQAGRIAGAPEDLERVVFAESPAIPGFHEHQVTARSLTHKWIQTASTPPSLVAYDLVTDPGEQHPLEDPAVLERGRALIAEYQALHAKGDEPTEIPISDEARQRLRALGYVQ